MALRGVFQPLKQREFTLNARIVPFGFSRTGQFSHFRVVTPRGRFVPCILLRVTWDTLVLLTAMSPHCGEAGAQRTLFLPCRNARRSRPHAPGQLRARYTVRALGHRRYRGCCAGPRFSGSKIWSKADCSMAGPLFTTSMRTSASSPVSTTRTGASGSPYLIALETRLRSSCCRRRPSQRPRVSPTTSSSSRRPGCAPRSCSTSSANTFAKSTFANVILIPKPNLVRLKSTKSSSSAFMEAPLRMRRDAASIPRPRRSARPSTTLSSGSH